MSDATIGAASAALGSGRIAFGAAMLLAPARTLARLRHPAAAISPTAVLMARMYGVRDIALGAFAISARRDRGGTSAALLATAAIDAGDAVALATLLRRRETRHLAVEGLAMAVPVAATALWLRSGLGAEER